MVLTKPGKKSYLGNKCKLYENVHLLLVQSIVNIHLVLFQGSDFALSQQLFILEIHLSQILNLIVILLTHSILDFLFSFLLLSRIRLLALLVLILSIDDYWSSLGASPSSLLPLRFDLLLCSLLLSDVVLFFFFKHLVLCLHFLCRSGSSHFLIKLVRLADMHVGQKRFFFRLGRAK